MSLMMDVRKKLGRFSLDIRLEAGDEAVALLGASGSGKSMTLKCIAGVVTPDEGKIVLNGMTLFDSARQINLPPQKRHVGLLCQNYALFPDMTVAKIMQIGMAKTVKEAERRRRASDMLDAMYLTGLEHRLPGQLSGGQQQRVALARILLSEPQILMLDEPFSALDSFLRWQLEQTMADTIADFKGTTLLVTHNRDEAYHLCGSIAVVADGRVDAYAARDALFRRPETREGALLTGCKNIADARGEGAHRLFVPSWKLHLDTADPVTPDTAAAGIRAHYFTRGTGENTFAATVERVVESPFSTIFMVRPEGASAQLRWESDAPQRLKRGDAVTLSIAAEKVLMLR